jgi:hypothetical protein
VAGFPLSATRRGIFQNFLQVLQKLADSRISGYLWIDGSFVTTKFNPRDVDIVLCIASDIYDNCSVEQRALLDWIESEALRSGYQCDAYISVEWPMAHPLHAEGVAARNYWRNFFGHTRQGYEKGIAVLQLANVTI